MLQFFFVCCRAFVVNKITNDYSMPMTPISSKMSQFLGKKILNRRFCLRFFFTTPGQLVDNLVNNPFKIERGRLCQNCKCHDSRDRRSCTRRWEETWLILILYRDYIISLKILFSILGNNAGKMTIYDQ